MGGSPTSGQIGREENTRILVKEEQVHVEKRSVVKEEVLIGQQTVTETQRVSGKAWHEELPRRRSRRRSRSRIKDERQPKHVEASINGTRLEVIKIDTEKSTPREVGEGASSIKQS